MSLETFLSLFFKYLFFILYYFIILLFYLLHNKLTTQWLNASEIYCLTISVSQKSSRPLSAQSLTGGNPGVSSFQLRHRSPWQNSHCCCVVDVPIVMLAVGQGPFSGPRGYSQFLAMWCLSAFEEAMSAFPLPQTAGNSEMAHLAKLGPFG